MIHSGLHPRFFAVAFPGFTRRLASSAVKPVAVALSGSFPYGRFLSTNPNINHEIPGEQIDKDRKESFGGSQTVEQYRRGSNRSRGSPGRYGGPIFPSLLRGGFEDFFTPSLFGHGPFDVIRQDPFFSRRRHDFFHEDMVPTMMMQRRLFPPDEAQVSKGVDKVFLHSSPGYKIKEWEDSYEISVDIPDGMDASSLQLELEEDGTVLHLSGESKTESKGTVSHQWFDKRFVLAPYVDTEKVTANLHDNVLVLTAPIVQPEHVENGKYTIPITTVKPEITREELVEKNYNDAFDESDWVETGKTASLGTDK